MTDREFMRGFTMCKIANRAGVAWTALVFSLVSGCVHYEPKPISPSASANGLETRRLDDAELKAFIATNAPDLTMEWPRPAWDLAGLTLVGVYYHPSLDLARAQWQAGQASAITAGGRPNPSISVAPAYTVNPARGMTPWIATIQFDVPIETAGKRPHRIARAEQLMKAAFLQLASSAWKVRSGVRSSLVDWTAGRLSVDLIQRQQELQSNIVAALERRLTAGAVANSEVALGRVALNRTLVSAGEAKARSSAAQVRLAQSLGLPLNAIAGVDIRFDLSALAAGAERFTTAAMRQQALQGRADILSALAQYAATEAALTVTPAMCLLLLSRTEPHTQPRYLGWLKARHRAWLGTFTRC